MADELPSSPEYWVGYLAMTMAMAHNAIRRSDPELAQEHLDEGLKALVASDAAADILADLREKWSPD